MVIKHSITLSTTEPNNEVGNLKIRQADEQTQTLDVQITADGVPKSFVGLQPFFCAKLGQTAGLGIIEQKVEGAMNPANGTLEYTINPEDWQILGRQTAYFSFRKMKDEHEWTEQFTTRDFNYNVIPNIFSKGIQEVKKDGGTYIWTIEDMLRLFKEYIATGKVEWENYKNDERTIWETYRLAEKINWDDYKLREKNEWKNYKDDGKTTWEKFVEDNREFLENADPGGKIILELLGGRGGFDSLGERLDEDKAEVTAQLAQIVLNVKRHGALGDGITDDTTALQNVINIASNTKQNVFIPNGTYIVTSPLMIPPGIRIFGDSTGTIIRKTNTTTINKNGTLLNTILYTEGYKITIDDISLVGSIDSGVNGITFGQDTAMLTLNRLHIRSCARAFHDFSGLWIAEFNKIHVSSCLNAFVLNENKAKTSLTFKNCWAENCGQSYELYRATYSSLINCGADRNSYLTANPYGKGYGNQATGKGVYDIQSCRGISIISCGAENCYGNGFVCVNASDVTITGFTGYFLKSEFIPASNEGVGFITTGSAKVTLNISSIYFEGFTNDKLATESPTTPVSLIANNYSVGGYGKIDRNMIIVNSIIVEAITPIFDGLNGGNNCLYVPTILDKPSFNDHITLGLKRVFNAKKLIGSGSTITIPITPDSNTNTPHMITIRGIDGGSNQNVAKGFITHIQFSSIGTVRNVSVLEGSTTGVTATGTGSNLVITLPNSYTDGVIVECSVISSRTYLINFLEATLS